MNGFEWASIAEQDLAVSEAALLAPDRLRFEAAIDNRIEAFGLEDTAVGLIDVNGFAELLARNGQEFAEVLLRAVAGRLSRMFEGEYVVSRIGVDTFGIVGGVNEIVHRRLEEVKRRPFKVAGREQIVSVSISIARAEECESTGRDVLLAATLAMKSAKGKGYGNHVYYSRALGLEARRHSELMGLLYAAIEAREMFLMYQPQIALETGKPIGMEALLRWRLANGELVSPEIFLPLAEKSGLAVELGYQVMTMALETGQRLRGQGFKGLRMAVNVSIPQFRDQTFVGTVQQAIKDSECAPDELELEITESVAGLGELHLIDMLKAIRALGVGIAIDDFGTGYSSLAYINRLPADRLKIDRAFVTSLGDGAAESCIAKTIIGMGHALGMKVLAEGVETEDQALLLREFGCDEVQGFYFARPMVEQDLKVWLERYPAD